MKKKSQNVGTKSTFMSKIIWSKIGTCLCLVVCAYVQALNVFGKNVHKSHKLLTTSQNTPELLY